MSRDEWHKDWHMSYGPRTIAPPVYAEVITSLREAFEEHTLEGMHVSQLKTLADLKAENNNKVALELIYKFAAGMVVISDMTQQLNDARHQALLSEVHGVKGVVRDETNRLSGDIRNQRVAASLEAKQINEKLDRIFGQLRDLKL